MSPDFSKYNDGLIPVIIQDHITLKVLMLGFMNEEALRKTEKENKVTFYSRSKQRLWTKGETSGNFLFVKEIRIDCDNDTFNESNSAFTLEMLERVIVNRKCNPAESSYTSSLFTNGINKIAQKVGEEAVELIIESKDDDKDKFLGEAADLLFHYLVLLQAKGYSLKDVTDVLGHRHK